MSQNIVQKAGLDIRDLLKDDPQLANKVVSVLEAAVAEASRPEYAIAKVWESQKAGNMLGIVTVKRTLGDSEEFIPIRISEYHGLIMTNLPQRKGKDREGKDKYFDILLFDEFTGPLIRTIAKKGWEAHVKSVNDAAAKAIQQ